MAYIYKITNNLNNKAYIGKTTRTPEIRLEEHIREARRDRSKDRPFYKAINKYGIENFTLETIEECEDHLASERERYWIEYFKTFKNGYNATFGGDGKPYIDYDEVVRLYRELKNQSKVAELLNIDKGNVSNILKITNTEKLSSRELKISTQRSIAQIDKDTNEILRVFDSIAQAEEYLGKKSGNISSVCKGKRKTACGYKWAYLN